MANSSFEAETIGVVLLNLGGPEHLEDVEPFLVNLFSDRKIIRLSPFPFLQKFIARRIAAKRAPKSREAYRLIGGGSPLFRLTAEQGQSLEVALAAHGRFRVNMAMRYWQPSAAEALAELSEQRVRKVVALTLYPHYSVATTGSSMDDLMAAAGRMAEPPMIAQVSAWPDEPHYIKALAGTVRSALADLAGGGPVELVYSAHSLPVKFIEEGDPYLDHIRRTIKALEQQTGVAGHLCFQSRSGPVRWLSPSTPEMLSSLAAKGCRRVLVVPISFVSDHVETLYEIDIQYKELAGQLGMELFRTAALNSDLTFIDGLAALVLAAVKEQGW